MLTEPKADSICEELDQLTSALSKRAEAERAFSSFLTFLFKAAFIGLLWVMLPWTDLWKSIINFLL